jgi:hypothetical protein
VDFSYAFALTRGEFVFQVPLGTVKISEPHLLDAMVVAGRLHSAPPGAVLLPSTIPVASTSGKVESGFWMERRKAHSHSISQSPGMLFVVDVSII